MKKTSIGKMNDFIKKLVDDLREDEVLILLAIARKKYNPKLKSEQVVFREVVNKETYIRKINKLITLIKHYPSEASPEDYSLYLSYNPRSLKKAFLMLRNRMDNWLSQAINGDKDILYKHLFKIDREFISCLQKPECRSRKLHFLIDVDDLSKLNEVEKQIEKLNIEVVHKTKTKNGMHILVKPFNIRLWKNIEGVEVKRDGVFHIYHVR